MTYYDFRNDIDGGPDAPELADHFAVHCHPVSEDCTLAANWGDEVPLTDASFDYLHAPDARGLFLGDYVGLASDGADFLPVFGQSFEDDPASVFFRRAGP